MIQAAIAIAACIAIAYTILTQIFGKKIMKIVQLNEDLKIERRSSTKR